MRADEDYVPEHEEAEDVEHAVGELAVDQTSTEDVEEEVEQSSDFESQELLRRATVVDAIRDMMNGHGPSIADLAVLTDHEREAMAFLQAVIEGRTTGGAFMYAEQRLQQLNLVLADLQPLLSVGGMEGLSDTLIQVVDGFGDLRHKLELLEEAQEEQLREPVKAKSEGEDGDDDKGDGGDPAAAAAKAAAAAAKAAAAAAKAAAATAAAATAAAASDDQPKKSTVWDPDDRGGGAA